MYSSYSLSKQYVYIPILAIQLFMQYVSSLNLTNEYLNHRCLDSQGKYELGSTYEKNVNHLFRYISKESYSRTRTNSIHISYGDAPDRVATILQCRGDTYESNCRSCLATAIAGLDKRCPKNRGRIIWYDQCFLYVGTNIPSPRTINYEDIFSLHNPNNVNGDTKSFNENTRRFLYNLILQADKVGPNKLKLYYAVGEKKLGTKKLYAMVQCARDSFDCKGCLEWSIRLLSQCCGSKQGARVLGSNCNVRYELYPFLRT